jgi:cytochrome c-type biogenesis protein CcmE
MNKRARNRLIGVTAIILVVVAAIFFGSGAATGAYSKTVAEVQKDPSLAGKRITVTGTVVADSWDKKTNPMTFLIRDEGATSGPELKVVYTGDAPNTFGNDTVAIVTGSMSGGVLKADDMITKCPSKYSTNTGAETIDVLLAHKSAVIGKPIRITGFLKPGTLKNAGAADRFTLQATSEGGETLVVKFEGSMPSGTKDDVDLVLGGSLDSAGAFDATSVSIATK